MGRFLNEIKYEILIGKIFGFVFFNMNSKRSGGIQDYKYFSLYLIFHGIIVCYNYVTYFLLEDGKPFWIIFMDQSFSVIVEISHIFGPIYYSFYKNKFKQLLITIDNYGCRLNNVVGYSIWTLKKPFTFFYFLMIMIDLVLNTYRTISYFFFYAIPLHCLFFQQYFIYKIIYELSLQYQTLNAHLLNAIQENQISTDELKLLHHRSFQSLQLSEDVNEFFGLPLLIDIFCSFFVLITCLHFWQYSGSDYTKSYVDLTENDLWLLWILCKLFFIIHCWTQLKKQVSLFVFNISIMSIQGLHK